MTENKQKGNKLMTYVCPFQTKFYNGKVFTVWEQESKEKLM